jgi:hypothetical protein
MSPLSSRKVPLLATPNKTSWRPRYLGTQKQQSTESAEDSSSWRGGS